MNEDAETSHVEGDKSYGGRLISFLIKEAEAPSVNHCSAISMEEDKVPGNAPTQQQVGFATVADVT